MHGDARPCPRVLCLWLLATILLASCARTDLLAIECGPGATAPFCQPANGVGATCVSTADCDPELVCWNGTCHEETWYSMGDSSLGSWFERTGGPDWGGGISVRSMSGSYPSLALDVAGNLVVAFLSYRGGHGNDAIYVLRFDGAHWVEVGTGSATGDGIGTTAILSGGPSLALDADGNPVVAWLGLGGTSSEIYVRRFDGARWVDVGPGASEGGGISNTSGASTRPSLAVDAAGNPVVAWQDFVSIGILTEIYVRRFNGTSWVEVGTNSATSGGISNNSAASYDPSLALDASGNPVVAWSDNTSGNYEIYVRRFNGTNWVDVGTSSSTAGGISNDSGTSYNPSLALDASGHPVVAWQDDTSATDEIYARRFDGASWVDVGPGSSSGGGISNNSGTSSDPILALDSSGNAVLAWSDDTRGNAEIYVRRFDGASWVDIGPGSSVGGGVSNNSGTSSDPTLALDASGQPALVWVDSTAGDHGVYAKRFDGTSWAGVGPSSPSTGSISNNSGLSTDPSLAVDDSGNPVVAWPDHTAGNYEIYVTRFNGASWVDVGPSSSAGGGLSNNSGASISPSVALDGFGNPVLAWQDYTAGNYEIYVARFNGASWVDVGPGSSAGGGLSNNSGASIRPTLALDDFGNPVVAWQDDTAGNYEIYVARFNGASWLPVGTAGTSGGGVSSSPGQSYDPSLALDASGNPVVAWIDRASGHYDIFLIRFDGASWLPVGPAVASGAGISNNTGDSQSPRLALDASGHPVVAWYNGPVFNDTDIYVARFDGASWLPVGPTVTSGGGVSHSVLPSLALDSSGHPVVAWQDDISGDAEIYVKRFDGTSWVELGSALAGNVSNSTGPSTEPHLTIAAAQVCVAWTEGGLTSTEIVMRCARLP